ncbi:hypothetical protein ACFLZ3_01555 [Candidatus Omnitrophota bacterium]
MINQLNNPVVIFENAIKSSIIVKSLRRVSISWRARTASCLRASITVRLIMRAVKATYHNPLNLVGIFLLFFTAENILFSLMFNEPIGVRGWTIRSLFLFSGMGCLISKQSWSEIKDASRLLKLFRRFRPDRDN